MNTLQQELPLFNFESFEKKTLLKSEAISTENKLVPPLVEVLESTSPISQSIPPKAISSSLKNSLDNLFPEQQYGDKGIQKAREILGSSAKDLGEDQLKDLINEVNFLVSTWLDEYERGIFNGLTLNELLHEKGGL